MTLYQPDSQEAKNPNPDRMKQVVQLSDDIHRITLAIPNTFDLTKLKAEIKYILETCNDLLHVQDSPVPQQSGKY